MTEIKRLHYETVTPLLRETLGVLMQEELFSPFRLVGGTNLSLRYGHRKSDDIDLFTDAEYRSLDFRTFEVFLRSRFPYYHCTDTSSIVSFGRSYYVGKSEDEYVKVDLMYSDPFLEDAEVIDGDTHGRSEGHRSDEDARRIAGRPQKGFLGLTQAFEGIYPPRNDWPAC